MKRRVRLEGQSIFEVAERAILLRSRVDEDFVVEFNGQVISVSEESSRDEVVQDYLAKIQVLAA